MAIIPGVQITNPTLLDFHNQREVTYVGTKQQIENRLPSLEASIPQIEGFKVNVRSVGKAHQEAETPTETTADMVEDLKGYLRQYEAFKITQEKSALLADNIMATMTFLTPIPRLWALENALQTDEPELYKQTKESERICLEHIAELKTSYDKIIGLNTKLLTAINDKTLTWSLERFLGIVSNDGKPLSMGARFCNYLSPYLFTPVIPKADEVKIPLPPVETELKNLSDSSDIIEIPKDLMGTGSEYFSDST